MLSWDHLFATIGLLGVTVATGLGAVWAGLKLFGEKWLGARFDRELEAFKAQGQRELEQLRFNAQTAMDRTAKLHSYEYEVLPRIWKGLNAAYSHVSDFVSPLQRYPDLDAMSNEQRSEFFEASALAPSQRNEISQSQCMTVAYTEVIFWHQIKQVRETYSLFHNDVISSAIFIEDGLKAAMIELSGLMRDALSEAEFRRGDRGAGVHEDRQKFRAEGEAKLLAIGDRIKARLWQTGINAGAE